MERVKTREDLEALLPLARAFASQENVVCGLDERLWLDRWEVYLERGSAIFCLRDEAGKPIGAIGAHLYENGLDGVTEAKEAFWFTDPDHRGGGLELLGAFEAWATDRGAERIWMVRLDGLRERAMDRVYARRGYRPVERAFCMEVR